MNFTLRFDLRVPPFAKTTFAAQYQACLDMAQWAEEQGFGRIVLAEHHGDEAGFMSAPLTLAAAILGRTRRIPVMLAALLAPLHDPVRLAEQIATIDCMAPGRFSLVVGAGYRQVEFAMAGVNRGSRGRRVEECVSLCRQAWTGKPFEWQGRTLLVTPPPDTPGGPMIFIGAKSVAAARRAARLHCPLFPPNNDPALPAAYQDECAKVDYQGFVVGAGASKPQPGFVMVSQDPEATWQIIGQHAIYDASTYASWQDDVVQSSVVVKEPGSVQGLRASGQWEVLTPAQCRELVAECDGITLHPLMGGIPPDCGWESLNLFAADVLPSFSGTAAAKERG
jgi:alkanesulfonate monooxygenase SsuD/methylene tetrahydromethanopterin reductase-like flavin-dependent oxidoreductase (luciferase family)